MKTGIVDYGASNLKSVKKAFDFLGAENEIITSPDAFEKLDRLVLPGVGSFGHAIQKIHEHHLFLPLQKWLASDKPFLGICLGLQLLFEHSEESPDVLGLGFFKGTCRRFQETKVPQIGWNSIHFKKEADLFKNIQEQSYFYFIHSYYVDPQDRTEILASTEYGLEYESMMERSKVCAVQFHPEKSGDLGIALLQNWLDSY